MKRHDESTIAPSTSDSHGREKQRKQRITACYDTAHHWTYIAIFSILGTLSRTGLIALNAYPGHLVPPLAWAQFIGCAIMAFLVNEDHLFPKSKDVGKYDALYIGLTTGYCGSLTSFSGWMSDSFRDLANIEPGIQGRARGYNAISLITQIMITFAVSFGGFRIGKHFASLTQMYPCRPIPKVTSALWVAAIVVLGLTFQLVSVAVAIVKQDWRGSVTFALVFSPLGALTRWYLSKHLNSRVPSFPIGTFTANVSAASLAAVFHLLQYNTSAVIGCQVLQGLQDGYCGTLSTVSTFVTELTALQKKHSYVYGSISVFVGLIPFILIDGIEYWTKPGRLKCNIN